MKIKLLLIDDDRISLLIAKKYLSDHCIKELVEEIIAFTEAEDALKLLKQAKSDQDQCLFWILLDVNMPKINGWEFLKLVEKYKLKNLLKVAMLTSSISEVDKSTAKSFDTVHGFFTKPLTQEKCEEFKALINQQTS
ncbi:response regulator [Algoriphagus yeomjeoni]|uniref:Response regulator receiver domain-containing protein n=1 Tax=Algoriphagus yeomjeoni TaxID=291403 RepID=A0A327PJ74_9BACT|nr:response regulator [Algoriphagus yeomjeoni]RAI91421.1 response regulator receiver domain-containing protein [Algoriphagus yeomjeoni]